MSNGVDRMEEPPEVLMARILKKKQRKQTIYNFASMGKLHRQYLIRNGNYFIFGKYLAAVIEIQRAFRGSMVRKNHRIVQSLRKKQMNLAATESAPLLQMLQKELIPIDLILKNLVRRKLCEKHNIHFLISFQSPLYNNAALLIQQKYKIHRNNLKKIVGEGKFYQNGRVHFFDRFHEAAFKIQRTFNGYKNKKIFDFYRIFVRSKELQDPSMALKFINPKELPLVEKGSQVFIKFRLSGPHFPPLIVYKIFLHSPICDVNSFAPRDYTLSKQPLPGTLFNKASSFKKTEHEQQYQRFENNNWRSIFHLYLSRVNHTVFNNEQIPLTNYISNEELSNILTRNLFQPKFHYSATKRQANYATKRKKRQLDWMLQTMKQTSHKVEQLPPKSVQNMLQKSSDFHSIEFQDIFTEDEQANAIIDWANQFDYEHYLKTWATIGSTHNN